MAEDTKGKAASAKKADKVEATASDTPAQETKTEGDAGDVSNPGQPTRPRVDLAEGQVLVLVDKPINVILEKGGTIYSLRKGTQVVPRAVAEHWYAKKAGVQIIQE